MRPAGTAGALFAIAVGAVLTFALHFSVSGVSIRTVGVIIMLAGLAGLVLVLARALTGLRRPEQPRRVMATKDIDPDREYLNSLRDTAPSAGGDERFYTAGTNPRPGAGQR